MQFIGETLLLAWGLIVSFDPVVYGIVILSLKLVFFHYSFRVQWLYHLEWL